MLRFTLLLTLAGITLAPAHAQNRPENDPRTCRDLWADVGLPERREAGQGRTTIVCHRGYVVGHNDESKIPDWVIERLDSTLIDGPHSQEGQNFRAEPGVPGPAQAKPDDYKKSGFDQGHQAPADDFSGDLRKLEDTFFLSNSVPQVGRGFNQSIWRSLESHVRKLVNQNRPVLYVITGPVHQESRAIRIPSNRETCGTEINLPVLAQKSICPENRVDKNVQCEAGVAVPVALYKIVYDPASQVAFAVLMTNDSHTGRYPSGRTFEYIRQNRVGIGTVETLTGLKFITTLPERKQRQMRTSCFDVRFR